MEVLLKMFLVIGLLLILCMLFILWRNQTAFKLRTKVHRAVYKHNIDIINAGSGERVESDEVMGHKSYNEIMFNFKVWEVTQIIEEKYQKRLKKYL